MAKNSALSGAEVERLSPVKQDQRLLEWALAELREAQQAGVCGSVTFHLHDGSLCKAERRETRRAPALDTEGPSVQNRG